MYTTMFANAVALVALWAERAMLSKQGRWDRGTGSNGGVSSTVVIEVPTPHLTRQLSILFAMVLTPVCTRAEMVGLYS
jgi:hypothetical protein